MIKFFRHIRRALWGEGKFSKYLLYAIGEIVLVVIGILIALQINNVNEQRKLRTLEIYHLKELRKTIVKDTVSISMVKSVWGMAVNGIEEINKAFDSGVVDSLDYENFGAALFSTKWEVSQAPYEALKSDGLSVITNDELRKQVISVFEELQTFIKSSEQDILRDDIALKNHCAILFDNVAFASDFTDGGFGPRKLTPHDLSRLQKDKLYRTLINTRLSNIKFLLEMTYERLAMTSYEKLLQEIDAELNLLEQ